MEKKLYYRYENTEENCFDYGIDKYAPDKLILKEKLLYGAHRNCFTSKEEAKTHFEGARKIAMVKYKNIINGIDKLKESLGDFSYNYFMYGDTHGIESDGMYITFKVNGYDFYFYNEG